MTIIEATFIGEDGSLGYQTGRRYRLRLRHQGWRRRQPFIEIIRTDSEGGYCPYESFHAFVRNWTDIREVGRMEALEMIAGIFAGIFSPGKSHP